MVAPFSSLTSHPQLKFKQMADYTVTYTYHDANNDVVTTQTSNLQSTLLVDSSALTLAFGSVAALAASLLAF